jgi:hypothetical protein
MAGLYDADKQLKMPGYLKGVLNAINMEAAFLTLLGHGPAVANKLAEWDVDMPTRSGDPTGQEGLDKSTGFAKHIPKQLRVYAQRVESPGYLVTDLAELTDTASVKGKQAAADQRAKDAASGLLSVQDMLLGNQDTANGGDAVDSKDRTRSVFSWLDNAAQATYPVPVECRPTAGQNYAGTLAALTEDEFAARLRLAGEVVGRDVDLVGYCGSALIQHMSDWGQKVPVTAASESSTRQLVSKQDEKRIIRKVTFFDFDGASVKTILQRRMMMDLAADNAATAYTTRSGVFLDMAMWTLEWLEPWKHMALLDQGGGPRGFHKGWLRLVCKYPGGQIRALIGS